MSKNSRSIIQWTGLVLGPVLFLLILLLDLDPGKPVTTRMAAVVVLMAVWWITEAIPLAATALIPLVAYPVLGILPGKETAPVYANSTIFLFLGGFMIARAMERWKLHRRIALTIIRAIGGGPSRIVLGFMIAAGFLSMWISNTATAIMMVPIGMAIIIQLEERFGKDKTHGLAVSMMLGIAYACSIGGIATLVGTPPNLSFARIFEITFPSAPTIGFAQWALLGVPLMVVMMAAAWLLLTRVLYRTDETLQIDRRTLTEEYQKLGPIRFEEKAVFLVFVFTALLWVFRTRIELGVFAIPGWSDALPFAKMIDDGTIALCMSLVLFLIPTRSQDAESPSLIDASVIGKLPWNIVLLFGGGFALAKGFQSAGLSELIGQQFASLAGVSPWLTVLVICLGLTFLTELTSNTATTEMVLPILAAVAVAMKVNPLLLMVPATISASFAFMMPVATPPNAIVFGSGRVSIGEMARAGVIINLIGVVVVTALFFLLAPGVFSIDFNQIPEWAAPSSNYGTIGDH